MKTNRAPADKLDLTVSIVLYKPDMEKLVGCLQSLYGCKLNWWLHLIDNSPEPMDAAFMAKLDKRVSYTHGHGNIGFGGGHNLAIHPHVQDARYWLVLNPDAYFGNGLLEELVERMDADEAIGLSIPHIRNPDGTTQLVNKRLPTPSIYFLRPFVAKMTWLMKTPVAKDMLTLWMRRFLLQDMDLERPLVCPFISGCFMFFRGSMLAELKGFDERYFLYMEDLDISRRAAQRGLNVVFSDITCYHHWERAAYKSRKLFMVLIQSCVKYFNKWGWVFDFERMAMNSRVRYYVGPMSHGKRRATV